MAPTPDILLVEDDQELRHLVEQRLSDSGYDVRTAETGLEALSAVAEKAPDLILLDIMLPELDGLEVCRRIRATHPLMYIIMLTARSEEMDRVVGLEVGADDYVTKPFSLSELVARVRSALRRLRLTEEQNDQSSQDETSIEGYDRTVDSHIQRLRSKIESDPGNPDFIKTVWGVGYKFQSPATD